MKQLTPATVSPRVRLANYLEVRPAMVWGPRSISDFELILIVSGRYSYEPSGKDCIAIRPGQVLCIPPVEEHVLRRTDNEPCSIISCIHLELDHAATWLQGGYDLEPFPPCLTTVDDVARMHDHFRYCRDLFAGYGRYRNALLSTMAKEIVLLLATHWETAEKRTLSHRTQQMIAYLREHLYDGVTRRELAAEFGLTPEYVNTVFKREVGDSPTAFVNRERILHGYALLRDHGMSVKEAAAATGFNDQFYFSKLFKRYLGVPPVRATWSRR